jgi:hypothetical protein
VANRQTCTVKTPRTNVPLHALLTLNDLGYVEAARVMAQQTLLLETDDQRRLTRIYRQVLGRPPGAGEQRILMEGLQRHRATYSRNPKLAAQWIRNGEYPVPSGLDPVQLAAWTLTASTVLNLDEALTKE